MARIKVKVCAHTYRFARPATTSRGTYADKTSWFVRLEDLDSGQVGYGEIPYFPGLSHETLSAVLKAVSRLESAPVLSNTKELMTLALGEDIERPPSSVVFGLECAMADLLTPEPIKAFPDDQGELTGLTINGLVWMDDAAAMRQSVDRLAAVGFETIKLKIGALDWPTEQALIEYARHTYPLTTLRVDANGAYKTLAEALEVCQWLHHQGVHSIEQPLPPGHPDLRALCQQTPLPIALDESLIGWQHLTDEEREIQLDQVSPALLVLKPSLIGGLASSQSWERLAQARGIDFWYTSALETPLSLGYLAEMAARSGTRMPHGLSTGRIFDPTSGPLPPGAANTEGQWLSLSYPPNQGDCLQAWWESGARP